MSDELIVNIILLTVICLGIFAIIREIICWYWKINERVDLQKKILVELVKLNKVDDHEK
tara:strand:+ start:1792 stop:1968 length:177 start_codon:yes stop_codon:yes gene_type:complete